MPVSSNKPNKLVLENILVNIIQSSLHTVYETLSLSPLYSNLSIEEKKDLIERFIVRANGGFLSHFKEINKDTESKNDESNKE